MFRIVKCETKGENDIGHGDQIELQVHVPQNSKYIIADENKVEEHNERGNYASRKQEYNAVDTACTYKSDILLPLESILVL